MMKDQPQQIQKKNPKQNSRCACHTLSVMRANKERDSEITPGCVDRVGCVVMCCDTMRCTIWLRPRAFCGQMGSAMHGGGTVMHGWGGYCGEQISRHGGEGICCCTALRFRRHRQAKLVVVPMVCTKLVVERSLHVEVRALRTSPQMDDISLGAGKCTRPPCRELAHAYTHAWRTVWPFRPLRRPSSTEQGRQKDHTL